MSKRYGHYDPCSGTQTEDRIVTYCSECEGEIYEGEPYYRFDDGFNVCDDCAFKALTTAEVPEEPLVMEDDDGDLR